MLAERSLPGLLSTYSLLSIAQMERVPLLELAKRRGLVQLEYYLKFKSDLEEVRSLMAGRVRV